MISELSEHTIEVIRIEVIDGGNEDTAMGFRKERVMKQSADNKKRIRWITQTAMFLALLIAVQMSTRALGSTLITGSLVNMLLYLSVMTISVSSGAVLSVLAPFSAKLVGHGPLWLFIPVIAAGNLASVILWYLLAAKSANGGGEPGMARKLFAVGLSAAVKFAVLYIGIVRIVVPVILNLPEPQAGIVSAAFSYPQLVTAVIGGAAALSVKRRVFDVLGVFTRKLT
jgi:hypothetical protein